MRKQWDFKKRKEFCGCALALLFAVAFAISTMMSIAMAAPYDIRIEGGGNAGQTNADITITNGADMAGANSIQTSSLNVTGSGANVTGGLTTDTLTVSGVSNTTGIANNGDITNTGNVGTNTLTTTGAANVGGAFTANGGANVTGGLTTDTLTVSGVSNLTGGVWASDSGPNLTSSLQLNGSNGIIAGANDSNGTAGLGLVTSAAFIGYGGNSSNTVSGLVAGDGIVAVGVVGSNSAQGLVVGTSNITLTNTTGHGLTIGTNSTTLSGGTSSTTLDAKR